ncbi:MAG: methylmalonyl-CoA mutase, partial [Alphaproteobacteria bacterium]|nr:methylmalonyl-CoA mutase [Alphaproteobacteria bacterium]
MTAKPSPHPQTRFAEAFARFDEAQWRALALKALKSAPFEKLVSKTYDGIEIAPLYPRAADAPAPAQRSSETGWTIFSRLDHPSAEQGALQAGEDLAGGAQGLQIVFAESVGDHGFGLPLNGELTQWIGGADPARCAFLLDGASPAQAIALADFIAASGLDPASSRASYGLDPTGALARGRIDANAHAQNLLEAIQTAQALTARGFTGPFLASDARLVHAAGGSEAQELAFIAASAVHYLRALEAAGVELASACAMLELRAAADANQFLTIAKLRALRRIWRRIEEACGLAAQPARIFAESAWRMMTRADAHVNFLRTTVAAFSAAAGGADAISILPYSQAHGLPDNFARRMARNTQIILDEETHAGHVADPAAGSGAIEALTQALAEKAWSIFQSLEAAGGIASKSARAML